MESAIKGKCVIPLEAMVKFVRLAHIYEQKDVMELLGEKIIEITQESSSPLMVGRGKALQLMIAMELLIGLSKRTSSAKQGENKRGVSAGGRVRSASVGRASVSMKEESAGGARSPRRGKGEDGGNVEKGGKAGGKEASPQNEREKGGGSPQEGRKANGGSPKGGSKGEGGTVSPKGKGEGKESKKKGAGKEDGEAATEGAAGGGNKNNEESQTS